MKNRKTLTQFNKRTSKKGKKAHDLQLPLPLLENDPTLPEEEPAGAAPTAPSPPGAGAGQEPAPRGAGAPQAAGLRRRLPQPEDSETLPLSKPQATRSTSTHSFAFLPDDSKQLENEMFKNTIYKNIQET